MEIIKSMFKSFSGLNELIITHPQHIRTIDVAQHILDLQDEVIMLKKIVEDYRQKDKKNEVLIDTNR
tara:strand:- start:124 stop:324 length:201 start_codon:yes stop_codon:yes gene_type:complete